MILHLPTSGARNLFAARLESRGMHIEDFTVILEADNIATIVREATSSITGISPTGTCWRISPAFIMKPPGSTGLERSFALYPLIAYLLSGLSLALVADVLFFSGRLFLTLPLLTAPAAALCGFFVALVWYFDIKNRERAKKKRTKALVAMAAALCCCIGSLLFLLVRMFV